VVFELTVFFRKTLTNPRQCALIYAKYRQNKASLLVAIARWPHPSRLCAPDKASASSRADEARIGSERLPKSRKTSEVERQFGR
jgi:hypothetical protein